MSRRATLPGADELFRVTSPDQAAGPVGEKPEPPSAEAAPPTAGPPAGPEGRRAETAEGSGGPAEPHPGRGSGRRVPKGHSRPERRSTGRERHEEKITVYVSPDELFDLEHARLILRGEHGIAADRGRIVREAVALALADLEEKGSSSVLVRRLRGR
jgi:hypothetical protein